MGLYSIVWHGKQKSKKNRYPFRCFIENVLGVFFIHSLAAELFFVVGSLKLAMTYDLGYEGTILEIYRHKFKSCSRFNAKQNASCLGALGLKLVVPGLLLKLQKYVLRLTSKR